MLGWGPWIRRSALSPLLMDQLASSSSSPRPQVSLTSSKEKPSKLAEDKALRIAARNRVTVYDSLFIALAKDLGAVLATLGRKQADAANREGVGTEVLWL